MSEAQFWQAAIRDGPLFLLLIALVMVLGKFILPLVRELSEVTARATTALEAAIEVIERNTRAFEQLHELLLRINGRRKS